MDIERALHKKCNQMPVAVAQRLILSMMRRCVGAWGGGGSGGGGGGGKWRSYQILTNDDTFEARPLCSLTRVLRNGKVIFK